jgi:hypothetical protein
LPPVTMATRPVRSKGDKFTLLVDIDYACVRIDEPQ